MQKIQSLQFIEHALVDKNFWYVIIKKGINSHYLL